MSKPRNSFSNNTSHRNSFRNQAVRNLKSTGWKAANSSARTADRAVGSLARWMVTNHSGMEFYMPRGRGFFGTIWCLIEQLLIVIFGSIIAGVLMFLLIAYGIPFLFMGHF